ncbi:MAG: hypothetical protein NZ561_08885, partial [Phycisphaerae bacterium]|nr:hypothetical protein [Phycisphaerae bacterium]MDW8262780.1 hypothetical protein [Phycisphaerales bacterium]
MNHSARSNGKNRRRLAMAASVASVMLAGHASAQVLYWDINGPTSGLGGAGNWDLTTSNWSTDPVGQVATQTWAANNTAVFSAGATSTGTFTVTVPSGVTIPGVNGIIFEEGVVTLAGGSGTSALNLNTGAVFAHGNVGSTANSRTHTINVNLTGSGGMTYATNYTAASTGTFIIGGNNTYTGQTLIRGVTPATAAQAAFLVLRPTTTNAFGPSGVGNEIVFGPGIDGGFLTSAALSRLEITNGQTWTKDITLTGGGLTSTSLGQLSLVSGAGTWAGNITVSGAVNVAASNQVGIGAQGTSTLHITGQMFSPVPAGSTWAKVGTGTVALHTASPSYSGFNRVFNGVLDVRADGALGLPAIPGLVEQGVIINALSGSNPTVAFTNNVNYATYEIITTGGSSPGLGFNNLGMIHGGAGSNRYAGDLRMGGPLIFGEVNCSIGVDPNGTFELAGKLWASAANNDVTPRRILKIGGGTLVISGENNGFDGQLTDPNNPSNPAPFPQYAMRGTVVINEGTLVLRSSSPTGGSLKGNENGAAQVPGSFNFQINPGGTFFLDNSLAVNTDRLGSTARALLTGGNLQLGGNATTPVTQSIPGGVAPASYSLLTVTTPGAATTLDLGNVTRDSRGTALVRGTGTANARIVSGGDFGTNVGGGGGSGSPLIGIIPALVGDSSISGTGTDLVTNDPTLGLR